MIMNEIQARNDELDSLANEAMKDAGFSKMLKFKKGDYFCDGQEVQLGTQMIAHCVGWTKVWIKFVDHKMVEKRVYNITKKQFPPEKEDMPDRDQSKWEIGLNGQPADPWVLQYLLPMEEPETSELLIFVTSSSGGKRAVSDLINAYVSRKRREVVGQPLIRLNKTMMPTPKFGNVPRPLFDIISFDSVEAKPVSELSEKAISEAEMEDEIPF